MAPGGFPESFLALEDEESFRWRMDFLRSYVEREIPLLGGGFPRRCSAASSPCWPTFRGSS